MNTLRTLEEKSLLNEAAFAIITEQAPDELPLFVPLRDRYLDDPAGYLRMRAEGSIPLAFGGEEVLEYMTIAVFPLLSSLLGWLVAHVVEQLAEAGAKTAGEEGVKQAIAWLRPLFARKPTPQPLFTTEELRVIAKQLNQIADREATNLGLRPHDVSIIRDMVISRLSLAQRV